MKRIYPLALGLLSLMTIHAQNISVDLARVVALAPAAAQNSSAQNNGPLDTIVATLAYYGGAPDARLVQKLRNGPQLLDFYADNPAVRNFLVDSGLDAILQDYYPTTEIRMGSDRREAFLRKPAAAELFTTAENHIDLIEIRQLHTQPVRRAPGLKSAARAAAANTLAPSADLIGNALAGLSDWITRRAQEELTYTFLNRLRDEIEEKDLHYLFPRTADYLPRLDLANYKAILPSIRKAFAEDLQGVTFNLGQYIDARRPQDFRDPALYNLFLVYRILDLERRDVPLADIVSFTYGQLADTRKDTRRMIDSTMATADTTEVEYQALLTAYDGFRAAVRGVDLTVENTSDELAEQQYEPLLELIFEKLDGTARTTYRDSAAQLYSPLNQPATPLGDNYWNVNQDPPASGLVANWLRGNEAFEYYNAFPTLARYDQLFGTDAARAAPQELRAAGLTALREILRSRQRVDDYRALYQSFVEGYAQLDALQARVQSLTSDITEKNRSARADSARLFKELAAEMAYEPAPELRLLQSIAREVLPGQPTARQQYAAIRDRLARFLLVNDRNASPNFKTFADPMRRTNQFPALPPAIERLNGAYDDLETALENFSAARANQLVAGYANLTTFETAFGIGQQLFFLLSDDGQTEHPFVPNGELSTFLLDKQARDLLGGVARQRVRGVESLGALSADGLTRLVLDFGNQLADRNHFEYTLDQLSELDARSVQRIAAVDFITTTLNLVLEAPILLDFNRGGQPTSLAERIPAFAKVPDVSRELNELFRLSQTGEFRYAIDNLLNLVELFDIVPEPTKKQRELRAERDRLRALVANHDAAERGDLKSLGLATFGAKNLPTVGSQTDRIADREARLRLTSDPTERADLAQEITDRKVQGVLEELNRVEDRLARLDTARARKFRKNFFRYGTFIADVGAADNPAEFEAALDAIALPPGSSRLKRTRPFTVEVGAYLGVTLAQETLELSDEGTGEDVDAWAPSLFAPIGLTVSKKLGTSGSAISLFGSVLDLGALTSFRIGGDDDNLGIEAERLPEFLPGNVFAPGLHLMYHFPDSPFTLGAGVQNGPIIREYRLAGEDRTRRAGTVRYMLSFSVDVPIFSFVSH